MGGEQSQQAIQYGPQQHDRPIDQANSLTGHDQVPPGTQIVGTRSTPGALPHIADGTYTPPTFNARALSAQQARNDRELSAQQARNDRELSAQKARHDLEFAALVTQRESKRQKNRYDRAELAQKADFAEAEAVKQAQFDENARRRERERLVQKAQHDLELAALGASYNNGGLNA